MNGIVAALGCGTVAGNAVHVDADLHAAAMPAVDTAVGRLGRNDEFDLASCVLGAFEVFVDDGLPAHTVAVLLLHGADNHDLVALGNEIKILHDLCAVSSSCHAALLVAAAAAIDDLVIFVARIRVVRPVLAVADADGVDVGVDGDDFVARAHPADDIAERVDLNLVVAEFFHLFLDAHDNALFLAALAGNGDHIAQKTGHIGAVGLCGFFDGFKIHGKPPLNVIVFSVSRGQFSVTLSLS